MMCKHYQNGNCRSGSNCNYAHGMAELRSGIGQAQAAQAAQERAHQGSTPDDAEQSGELQRQAEMELMAYCNISAAKGWRPADNASKGGQATPENAMAAMVG